MESQGTFSLNPLASRILPSMRPRQDNPLYRWIVLWVGCPLVSIVLGTLLFFEIIGAPRFTLVGQWTSLENLVTYAPDGPWSCYLVKDEKGLYIIDEERDSADKIAGLIHSSGNVVYITCRSQQTGFGMLYAWTTRRLYQISLGQMSGTWTESELNESKYSLVENPGSFLGMSDRLEGWLVLAKSEPKRGVFHWTGPLFDVATILTILLLTLSIRGWSVWFASRPWSKRSRRLARGHCPDCGYDLSGNATGICPECGNNTEPRA